MCVSIKRHDAIPFLPVGDQAMGTIFPIPGRFAQSPAVGSVGMGLCPDQCTRRLESPAQPRQCAHIWSGGRPQARPRILDISTPPLGVCPA